MSNIKKYEDIAWKLTEKAQDYNLKLRNQIGNKIRKEVLLPFCRKHNLQLEIRIYDSVFILPDDTIVSVCDITEYIDDPIGTNIKAYLEIYFMNDYIFDYNMLDLNITKNDLKSV